MTPLSALQHEAPAADGPEQPAPFEIVSPVRTPAPLVFASPHSGRIYPAEMTAASPLSSAAMRRSEDAFVDDLVSAAPTFGWPLITARYARAYVDLNRAPYELDAAMFDGRPAQPCTRTPRAVAGFGSVPSVVGEGAEIYDRRLSFAEVEGRLTRVYLPYRAALEALLQASETRFGCAVLVDWHSMPAAAVSGPSAPEVVVGDRHGRACAPAVADLIEDAFRALGYATARNRPYAGGHVTETHGRPHARRHAVQIELRRDLYLDEATLRPGPGYGRLKADLQAVCARLAAAPWTTLA